jgi:hypothetical protein
MKHSPGYKMTLASAHGLIETGLSRSERDNDSNVTLSLFDSQITKFSLYSPRSKNAEAIDVSYHAVTTRDVKHNHVKKRMSTDGSS